MIDTVELLYVVGLRVYYSTSSLLYQKYPKSTTALRVYTRFTETVYLHLV